MNMTIIATSIHNYNRVVMQSVFMFIVMWQSTDACIKHFDTVYFIVDEFFEILCSCTLSEKFCNNFRKTTSIACMQLII